jgi:uncharacterized protein (DUF2141 family)
MSRKNTSPWDSWKGYRTIKASLAIWLLASLSVLPVALSAQSATLTIEITNIRFNRGWIRIGLYNHPDQFPALPSKTYDFMKTSLKEGMMEIILDDILPGTYAISLLDDVNGNDRMDYKLLKIPGEGFGFSNNIKPKLKHPSYDHCSFSIPEGPSRISIEMQYLGKKT